MRAWSVAALVAMTVASAGCVVQVGDEDQSDDGQGSSVSELCINGLCRRCVDGECTGALVDLEREAAGPHPDVAVHESHNMTLGLPTTSWTFWVSPNATAHVALRIADVATGQGSVLPNLCLAWERWTPTGRSSGGQGSCGGGSVLSVNGPGVEPKTVLAWDSLAWGKYTITASAQAQPNELLVDIVVDNP